MPKKTSRKPIRNVVVISDTHVGCSLALMHPDGAVRDDNDISMPGPLQRKVWGMWLEFWEEWVPEATRGEPFMVVHNGDAIDGSHHNSTTQWSHNLKDQVKHARKILQPVVDACEGRYYHIRGTEAHVGKSAKEEESLAELLGAIPNDQGQHARYELWLRIGGQLIHFLHHVGTTSSSAHESSAVNAELAAMYNEAGRWQDEPPKIIVRSHRHRSIRIGLPADGGDAEAVVTAAWQLKSAYAYKIAGARTSQPQIGGAMIRHGDQELYVRTKVWRMERPPEVVIG